MLGLGYLQPPGNILVGHPPSSHIRLPVRSSAPRVAILTSGPGHPRHTQKWGDPPWAVGCSCPCEGSQISREFPTVLQLESYLFHSLEVKVAELNDIDWLVSKDLTGVVLEDGVKVFWQTEFLSIFGSHNCWFEFIIIIIFN
jgi:hypothetical protein